MANKTAAQPNVDLTKGQLPTSGAAVNKAGGRGADDDVGTLFINEVNPYEFMRHADLGTGGFLYGHYLTQHTRERDFKERRNYSFYLNFVKRIINALVNPLFREQPVRTESTGNAFFASFLLDCDRRGHSFAKFMRKTARKVKRYGLYFVVVENDPPEKMAKNLAEARRQKQHPYIYTYSPENIEEYEWDELGRLTRIVFREWTGIEKGKRKWIYREWTKEGWETFERDDKGKRKKIEGGKISIGVLPIVPIYAEEPDEDEDPVLIHPPLYHIARTNLGVYDQCSELRELERNQMFSLLTIPRKTGQQVAALEIGTKNAIGYDAESTNYPRYISPDAEVARAVMEDRDFNIRQIFEMAALQGIASVSVKEESGKAREWEFQATSEALADFGDTLQDAEKAIVHLVGLYLNKPLEYEVKYSDNYGLVDIALETEKASAALELNVSPEVNAEVKKAWTRIRFRDMQAEDLDKLIESITVETEDEVHARAGERDRGEGSAGEGGGEDDEEAEEGQES
jgi:hypothetical protein